MSVPTKHDIQRWRQFLPAMIRAFFKCSARDHSTAKPMYCSGCERDMTISDIYDLRKHPASCEMRRMYTWVMKLTRKDSA